MTEDKGQEQSQRGYRWWHWTLAAIGMFILLPTVLLFLLGLISARLRRILTPARIWIISVSVYILIVVVTAVIEDMNEQPQEQVAARTEIATPAPRPTVRPTPPPAATARPPTPPPAATARPTPRPAPTPIIKQTLGVSTDTVQRAFEELGFTFERTPPDFGIPAVIGYSPDEWTSLELQGSGGELEYAMLSGFMDGDNNWDVGVYLGTLTLSIFGEEGADWLLNNMNIEPTSEIQDLRINNADVSFHLDIGGSVWMEIEPLK